LTCMPPALWYRKLSHTLDEQEKESFQADACGQKLQKSVSIS